MSIFVINGFYMSMRDKYVENGASITYFLVEWDEGKTSWADFRGKVLGATDPVEAASGSARNTIFKDWKALGLKSEPNVGDNGVHASASPFEAMAERLNWCGAKLEDDAFGKALLAAGVPKDTILSWCQDPQVDVDGKGKMGSLFDAVEDTNASDCIKALCKIAKVKAPSGPVLSTNSAFVFIKPHAVFPKVAELVQKTMKDNGIKVTASKNIDGKEIDSKLLIDTHYGAIASKATRMTPAELNVPQKGQDEFKKVFGLSWADALAQGRVYNAKDGCKKLGINGTGMDKKWAVAKKAGKLVKFGGGFYAGEIPSDCASSSAAPPTPSFPALVALAFIATFWLTSRR